MAKPLHACNGMKAPIVFPGRTAKEIAESITAVANLPVECCQHCRFSWDLPNGAKLCRRYPPTMTMLAVPVPLPAGYIPRKGEMPPVTFQNSNVYPQTVPDNWCGEWSPGPGAL